MPIYLKEVDLLAEVAKFQSALIVVCRFCPAASLAVRNNKTLHRVLSQAAKD